MTHRELMKLFKYAEEAVRTQVATIEEPDGQFKVTSMKEILDQIKPDTGLWIQTPRLIPKCSFCEAYSEDADIRTFFAEDNPRNGQLIHYCSNCGAYLGEASY